jgi:hypothetical protein
MICELNNIEEIIENEGLDLIVVSYGGSCSNQLVHTLKLNNYKCETKIWMKILCHCPYYIKTNIPIIYIYDNPIKSFLSMKRRGNGIWDVNQRKLSNNNNVALSDENLLKLMINQFHSWTNVKRENVLVIKSCELFENNIVNKLEKFLNKKITNFPISYKNPKTNIEKDIKDENDKKLFEKYKLEIDEINAFAIN